MDAQQTQIDEFIAGSKPIPSLDEDGQVYYEPDLNPKMSLVEPSEDDAIDIMDNFFSFLDDQYPGHGDDVDEYDIAGDR